MSREYALVKPAIWNGKTGRAITRRGKDARICANYLVECPHANLIGLFYVAIPTIAYETGLTPIEVNDALDVLDELSFASYDSEAEVCWVLTMARYQLNWKGAGLTKDDKRAKAAAREYRECPENKFLGAFFDTYAQALHLTQRRGASLKPLASPLQAPHKPLARVGEVRKLTLDDQDHEQDQDSDQEHDHEQEHDHGQDGEPEGKDGSSFEIAFVSNRIRQIAQLLYVDTFESRHDRDELIIGRIGNDYPNVDVRRIVSGLSEELWESHLRFHAREQSRRIVQKAANQ